MTQGTPKLWRDMTDAEKGALLLAKHEGKVVQYSWEGDTQFHDFSEGGYPIWNEKVAYRIKPEPAEPKREVECVKIVNMDGFCIGRGTVVTKNGKPDPDTITMSAISEAGE